MRSIPALGGFILLLTSLSTTSPGAAFELDPGMRARPGADAGPTRVSMELFVIDIAKIDDRDQIFKADVTIRLQWHDPRLARPGETEVITLPLTDIWNPRLRIYNQRDIRAHFPEIARIGPDGLVAYEQRYSGDFTASADIHRFPFDKRTVTISMLTVDHRPSEIRLDFTEDSIDRAVDFSIPNWTIGEVVPKTGVFRALGGREFLRFDIEMKGSRRSSYHVWSVIVPLILIVMMSWSVFFVKPKHLGSQMTLAATSMLTLIAYRFAVSSVLPPVPYMTSMDIFITGSTVFVFLALAEAVSTGALADNDHNMFAERLDGIARYLFPSVFVVFLAITFLF